MLPSVNFLIHRHEAEHYLYFDITSLYMEFLQAHMNFHKHWALVYHDDEIIGPIEKFNRFSSALGFGLNVPPVGLSLRPNNCTDIKCIVQTKSRHKECLDQ